MSDQGPINIALSHEEGSGLRHRSEYDLTITVGLDPVQMEKPQEKGNGSVCKRSHSQVDVLETSFRPREATKEEIGTLPHVVDHLPFAVWPVVIAGAMERFTYFGLIAPWRA